MKKTPLHSRPRYLVTDWRGRPIAEYFCYADAQDRAVAYANATAAKTRIWGPDGRLKWECQPPQKGDA